VEFAVEFADAEIMRRGTGMAMLENLALRNCSNEGTDSAEVSG